MEKQQAFETVAKHLFTQGEPATDEVGCKYLYGEMKCAIGCLIPDDKYDAKFENNEVTTIVLNTFGGKEEDKGFYGKLQALHDSGVYYQTSTGRVITEAWATSNAMRTALQFIGEEYKLSTAFLDELKFKDK
jgi:hypothetical protein